MTFAFLTLAHTPPAVYALLAYLAWQGIRSLRPRRQPVWRLLIVPAGFTATSLLMLLLRPSAGPISVAAWLGGAAALAPLGLATGPRLLAVDPQGRRVACAGSPLPLARNLLVFCLQYGIAVALARRAGPPVALALASLAVSGGSAGYFLGWAVGLRRSYRARARADGVAGPVPPMPPVPHRVDRDKKPCPATPIRG